MTEVRKAESSMSRCWNQINISICRQIRCQYCLRLLGAHPSCSGVFRVLARSFPVPSLLACVLVGVNLGSDEIIIIINRRREDIPYGRPISSKESGVSTNNIMSLLIPNSVMMWNTHFFIPPVRPPHLNSLSPPLYLSLNVSTRRRRWPVIQVDTLGTVPHQFSLLGLPLPHPYQQMERVMYRRL